MFRELLESNGFDVKCYEICEGYIYTQVDIFKKMPSGFATTKYSYKYLDNGTTRKEEACMQYCIENGVRLEWLPYIPTIKEHKFTDWVYQDGIPKLKIDKETKIVKEIFADEKGMFWGKNAKLLSSIFAHDIKIIA